MSRRCYLVAGATMAVILIPGRLARAQTPDISGPILPYATATVYDLDQNHWRQMLNTSVPTAPFHRKQPFKDALIQLYEILSAEGFDLPIIADMDAIKEANPRSGDIYAATVQLPAQSRSMPVRDVLRTFRCQLPHRGIVFKIVAFQHLEITVEP